MKTCLFGMLMAFASAASATTIEVEVNGLVCAFCAQGIEKTLRAFPATDDVLVSLEHRLVAIALKDAMTIDEAALRKAITDAGYTTVSIKRSADSLQTIRERVQRRPARGR